MKNMAKNSRINIFSWFPEDEGGGELSGITEKCGTFSHSRSLGPLFSCKSSLQAELEITLNCINFLHAIFKQH